MNFLPYPTSLLEKCHFGICFSVTFTIVFALFESAKATPAGCGCTKGIVASSITFTLTTKTTLGNEVEIQDPSSVIIGYVQAIAQAKATEAATKKSSFLATISAAWSTGRGYASNIGLLAEFVSSAGLYIDNITMSVEYNCCDGSSASPKTATADEDSLFLNMRSPADVKKLPNLYVGVMVDAASKMVDDCPK